MNGMTIPRSLLALSMASALGCASASRKAGPTVAVYEADAALPQASRRLPEGCRLLAMSGPIDQMESERATEDPYRRQRRETAENGGNVLLVLSERTVTRPGLDCPTGDTSADCLRASKSWYRVSFEQYACDADAARSLAELKAEPHRGGITIPLWTTKPKEATSPALAPPELKAKVLEMIGAGVAPAVVLSYVKGERLSRKMTAEEIIDWTKSGIPDAVIDAAASR
jgi:glycine/D-amino acid oxidase-like deaminating enzyme